MTFLDRLQADREIDVKFWRKHPELKRQLVDDAYPDEAHFIYELLQNAEDAQATLVEFELLSDSLVLRHDGKKLFSEPDVEAITDVSKTGKDSGDENIGRFGIGFKSVFKYTESPRVYSGAFSFEIVDFVYPRKVPPIPDQESKTTFVFLFNNAKKRPEQAFSEIQTGLEELSETTLLFLNSLRCIRWTTENQRGTVVRKEHSDIHIEIHRDSASASAAGSHWLRFAAPVDGLERQKVAVAYELVFLGEQESFKPDRPLSEQMKIVSAEPGTVAVFFPAEKERSGLRFHLHAPFVPELSRASIKSAPANLPLFDQLGRLAAHSLHRLKELGLLTGEFLAVLPNNDEALPDRYQVIRLALIQEMREHALTPTYIKGYAPAKTLLQARAALKELLSGDDLQFLLGRNDNPTWAIGATLRNSNQDRFLSSLGLQTWDIDSLIKLLRERAHETAYPWLGRVDPAVTDWLGSKTAEWHQQLYAVLYRFLAEDDDFSTLRDLKVVRLASGDCSIASKAYFPSEHGDKSDPFLRVSSAILTAGNRKAQQSDAKKLLEKIGVREVGESEQVDLILKERYAKESEIPPADVYATDLKRFLALAEKNPSDRQKFGAAYIFKIESTQFAWGRPHEVFLDVPFKNTGLLAYHQALSPEGREKWPLSDWYLTCGIEVSKLTAFAEAVGCFTTFTEFILETRCEKNPRWEYLKQVPGANWSQYSINRDYTTSAAIYALLQSKNVEFSRLVWRTMCSLSPHYLAAVYQKSVKGGQRSVESSLIHLLRQAEWIPLRDGRFVAPRDAERDGLLSGFGFDSADEWLELVHFGKDVTQRSAEHTARAQKRADLGFETDEELERAKAFVRLPIEDQRRILENHKAQEVKPPTEFPIRPVKHSVRNERVREQALQTPEKETRVQPRATSVGYEAVKADANLYLQDQYTNAEGVMFCQICKFELPFRLPSKEYYFEAVEAVTGLPKRFRENFLALCPNHAAMFQYVNEHREDMREILGRALGVEIEVTLANEPLTIRFTETHLADMNACLQSLDT